MSEPTTQWHRVSIELTVPSRGAGQAEHADDFTNNLFLRVGMAVGCASRHEASMFAGQEVALILPVEEADDHPIGTIRVTHIGTEIPA